MSSVSVEEEEEEAEWVGEGGVRRSAEGEGEDFLLFLNRERMVDGLLAGAVVVVAKDFMNDVRLEVRWAEADCR